MPLRHIAFAMVSLLLASCARNPAYGGYDFTLVSAAEERNMGEASARYDLLSNGLYRPASKESLYVTEVCNRMYAVTEAAAAAVQCNVLDTDIFNASATPGYIHINRGILAYMSSESELAAVLGHESGHLTARHTANQATLGKLSSAAGLGLGIAAGAAGAGFGTVQAVGSTKQMADIVGFGAYNRAQETEADTLGRRYLEKAGYNPQEMVNMVSVMQLYGNYNAQQKVAFNSGNTVPQSLLDKLKSSHPATEDRLQSAVSATGAPVASVQDTAGRERYLNAIDGMTFGPARRYGIARHHELVLPRQRVVMPLPAGTTTAYIPSGVFNVLGTWLVAHPESGSYLALTSVKIPAGSNPGALVNQMLPALHGPVERIPFGATVAELPATSTSPTTAQDKNDDEDNDEEDEMAFVGSNATGYTATYRFLMNDRRYRMVAFPAPATVDQMLVINIVYPSEATLAREDTNLLNIIREARFLTKRQAKRYKQLQLHTFRAATGDSITRQSSKLPVGSLQEGLFRALNNLPAGTEMQTGLLYKTIVDPNN